MVLWLCKGRGPGDQLVVGTRKNAPPPPPPSGIQDSGIAIAAHVGRFIIRRCIGTVQTRDDFRAAFSRCLAKSGQACNPVCCLQPHTRTKGNGCLQEPREEFVICEVFWQAAFTFQATAERWSSRLCLSGTLLDSDRVARAGGRTPGRQPGGTTCGRRSPQLT
jgi:hypothetical protein